MLRVSLLPHKRGIMTGILLSAIVNLLDFSLFGGSVYGFLVLSFMYQILYLVD
jgi:cell shape-determining protein MreD